MPRCRSAPPRRFVWPSWWRPCRWPPTWASGQPMEHCLRQMRDRAAARRRLGLDDDRTRRRLLPRRCSMNVDCHADAHEQASGSATTSRSRRRVRPDFGGVRGAAAIAAPARLGQPPLHRVPGRARDVPAARGSETSTGFAAHPLRRWRAVRERSAWPERVLRRVCQAYEHWDGKGCPDRAAGDDDPLPARLVQLAESAEVFAPASAGSRRPASRAQARGEQFDPALVDAVLPPRRASCSPASTRPRSWDAVIDAEPRLLATRRGARARPSWRRWPTSST